MLGRKLGHLNLLEKHDIAYLRSLVVHLSYSLGEPFSPHKAVQNVNKTRYCNPDITLYYQPLNHLVVKLWQIV